jgi:transposase-like protein
MMKRITQKKNEGKRKNEEVIRQLLNGGIDTKVELIQSLIPLGLLHVGEVLQQEVAALAGGRYSRGGGPKRHVRWGQQPGYVYLGGQRLGLSVPRVRDREDGNTTFPEAYREFQKPRGRDEALLSRLLGGLSGRRYEESAKLVPEVLGLSPSSVSRRFIAASARKLESFGSRSLGGYDLVAIFMDGKTFGGDQLVIALGVDIHGKKIPLGFVQTATENAKVCKEFLAGLLKRGLKADQGILFVVDGAKGLSKAIEEVFSGHGIIQRCQWHKRENVVSYLPKETQAGFRRKLQQAYEKPTQDEAQAALGHIAKELKLVNLSAVSSLQEGLEETLTLHRLGLFSKLGISFKTTNCIESLNSQVGRLTRRVSRWTNSDQKQRWMATALLDIEPRLRKTKGFRYLPLLRLAIQKELGLVEVIKTEGAAA